MKNFKKVHGKRISMIVWGKEDDVSDKVIVYAGIADWDGARLTIHWNSGAESYVLPDDWLRRVKPVQPQLKFKLLDADYALSVSIGTLPDDIDSSDLKKAGIIWPQEPNS